MKMQKLLYGIYSVKASDLPETKEFVREDPKDGKIQPLMHVCERDNDPTQAIKTFIIVCEKVRWDFYHGYYTCVGCKKAWRQPENLKKIWEDGYGTGEEAQA